VRRDYRGRLIGTAHALFDKVWQGHSPTFRRRCYQYLRNQLGIDDPEAHFSTLTIEQLERAIPICERMTVGKVRRWWKREQKQLGNRRIR